MTAAQREARDKAYDILGEQFDHVLIALSFETDQGCVQVNYWKGGYIPALGLATYAQNWILTKTEPLEEKNY